MLVLFSSVGGPYANGRLHDVKISPIQHTANAWVNASISNKHLDHRIKLWGALSPESGPPLLGKFSALTVVPCSWSELLNVCSDFDLALDFFLGWVYGAERVHACECSVPICPATEHWSPSWLTRKLFKAFTFYAFRVTAYNVSPSP